MPIYEDPDQETVDLVHAVMESHHPELAKAGVVVAIRMAMAKRDKEGFRKLPALKIRGTPANGAIRATSPLERSMGVGDAVMFLDGEQWPDWSDAQRRALIDHELTHLIVADTGDDDKDTDDYGRPKLSMRPHDREFGWFDCVAKRHGAASFEVAQYRAFEQACISPAGAQLWLPFSESDVSGETKGEARGPLTVTMDDVARAEKLVTKMSRRRAASKR